VVEVTAGVGEDVLLARRVLAGDQAIYHDTSPNDRGTRWSNDGTRMVCGGRRYDLSGNLVEQGVFVGDIVLDGSGVPAQVINEHLIVDMPLNGRGAQSLVFIAPGTVIMVVREADPARVVRITHMGFVVKDGARLVVRHASTGDARAVIDEEYRAFLERQETYKKWKVAGVALAKPLDASARVARLGTERAAR